VKKGQSHSINIISRDVEKCVVQQKDYEGGENDCEVNMSANPWKERERRSEDYVYRKEIKENHTHTHKRKNSRYITDQVQKKVTNEQRHD